MARDSTSSMVIGEVVGIHIDDAVIVNGHVDVTRMQPIARLGYMDYCVVDEHLHHAAAGGTGQRGVGRRPGAGGGEGCAMKLHWSPRSPFVRKVMVFAHECGLADRIECIRTVAATTKAHSELMKDNPLSKIPTLIRDDGVALYELFGHLRISRQPA